MARPIPRAQVSRARKPDKKEGTQRDDKRLTKRDREEVPELARRHRRGEGEEEASAAASSMSRLSGEIGHFSTAPDANAAADPSALYSSVQALRTLRVASWCVK